MSDELHKYVASGLLASQKTSGPGPSYSKCPFCHRFQGDSHLEQPGCYHHCVDENIERRNHYLDLAGIENYTSQFGPGKGLLGGVYTRNTVLGSGHCSLRTCQRLFSAEVTLKISSKGK